MNKKIKMNIKRIEGDNILVELQQGGLNWSTWVLKGFVDEALLYNSSMYDVVDETKEYVLCYITIMGLGNAYQVVKCKRIFIDYGWFTSTDLITETKHLNDAVGYAVDNSTHIVYSI